MLVKLDNRPEHFNLETLELFKTAYDMMDIFNHLANRYKLLSKILYATLLILSVFQTTFTIYGQNFPRSSFPKYSIPTNVYK